MMSGAILVTPVNLVELTEPIPQVLEKLLFQFRLVRRVFAPA